ncbi:BON domain-containing protein [Trinickia sp.]|uniref:BON domain-containing protein n=1 Tax=Trinickia sp. TaxID=2571163 RepID=UPI003F7CF813
MKSDEELRQDVVDELEWDPAVEEEGIQISVRERVVTLEGTVPSLAQKIAVEKAVQRVDGVRAFVVRLQVSADGASMDADGEIEKAVRTVLDATEGLPADAISVTVDRGCVTLAGTLDWGHQRRAAELAVGRLRGVVGIVNRIAVCGEANPDEIGAKILGALKRRARADAQRLTIEVRDGVVTLSGAVHSFAEKRAAHGVAWATRGVRDVIDRMTVE